MGDNMQYLTDIITNHVILAALVAWAVTQTVKVLICTIKEKKFNPKRIVGEGGMPSGHTATVMAAMTMCGLIEGFDTPLFALAGVFAIVVIKDAVGVRLEVTKHAAVINRLAEEVNSNLDEDKKIKTDSLKRLVGHTPAEVGVGAVVGIIVAILYYIIVFLI
jgi:acid phosphatase family membrane protein YuiD